MSNEKHKIDPDKAHQAMRRVKQQHIDIFNYAKGVQSDGIENLYNAWSTPNGKKAVNELKEGLNSCMSGGEADDTVNKVYNWLMVELNTLISSYCNAEGISYSTVSPENYPYPFKKVSASQNNYYDQELLDSSLKKISKLSTNIEKNMKDTVNILTSGSFGIEGTEILDVASVLKNKMEKVCDRVKGKIATCTNAVANDSEAIAKASKAARKKAKSS